MATMLMGYDTEYHAIGENLARGGGESFYGSLPDDTTEAGLDIITAIHEAVGVTGTLFVCGRTLLQCLPAVRKAAANPLLDVQQHTYSHILFKDDTWKGGLFPQSPPEALRHELGATSALIKEHLGTDCIGLRTPHGYYLGLSDRPDRLQLLADTGIEYVTSWGRNSEHDNPAPFDIQPFWYEEQGFPDILELPFQHWSDAFWFEGYGIDRGAEFLEVLKEGVDEIVDKDLVYGACFHEWAMIRYNEAGTGWARGVMEYALEQGVEVMSYTDYYNQQLQQRGS
jgi:peptidoglycan/xylan/chitin deacetylase (PgdA/CDA1 family)